MDKAPEFLETDWLLGRFGRKKKPACENYRRFVESADDASLGDPHSEVVGGAILGSPEFVKWVKDALLSKQADQREIPQLRRLRPGIPVSAVVDAVCTETGLGPEDVIVKGKKRNQPRDLAIFLARDLTGDSCVELGRRFGGVGGPAITTRYNIFRDELKNSIKLRRLSKRVRNRIMNN